MSRLYKTTRVLTRRVRVAYPAGRGQIVLRTEADWERNIEAVEVSEDGTISTFEIRANQPFLYFKPFLLADQQTHWSICGNHLLLMTEDDQRVVYPAFTSPDTVTISHLVEIDSPVLGRPFKLRVVLPPGYHENTLARYPVAYMQDGQNLFFPEEAFQGQRWNVGGTGTTLRTMRLAEDFIFVGIHSSDRMKDYTKPGYETYAKALVEDVISREPEFIRGNLERRSRTVWGSSLGGVVSFYCAWQYPEVFGAAVCMSSTFSHQDDLIERVLGESPRDIGVFLDSGWPGDNFEVTLAMATALISRGWRYGHDLMHLSFPYACHNEQAWGERLHLPLQFLNGAVARASRTRAPELSDHPYRIEPVP
jgi:predicted alpha/beta superfamily hydrolase